MTFLLKSIGSTNWVSVLCVGILIVSHGLAVGTMTLLSREMFEAPGNLTAGSPGTNFSQVLGTLRKRPGGPHLVGRPPASADLREPNSSALGRFNFASSSRKIFVGGWYLIKDVAGQRVDLLGICDPNANLSPSVSIVNGQLGAAIWWSSTGSSFTPSNLNWSNRWIYLGIAVHLKSGSTADVRFFYKWPGQSMQSLGAINDGSIGMTSLGQMLAGSWCFGPQVKGRLGAPSAYTFTTDDFSDIAYPSDVIEPATGSTWYCDPLNGSDAADGATSQTAWKTAAKINEESSYTGLLPSNSYQDGDTLIINTAGQVLDLNGIALKLSTPGLNVRAATGQEWIRVKSYRSLPMSVWQTTTTPNVYATSDTQANIVLWEDDKFMNHPLGSTFAIVESQLSSTQGSFWTDGTTLYVHPFGNTDPRVDGKRYERSYSFADGTAIAINAPNLSVQDLHAGKTCLTDNVIHDPIGGYCLGTTQAPGKAVIRHCYLYYGSKHVLSIVQGAVGDDVLIEDVQAEQATPYPPAGYQTVWVSFNHQALDLGIIHRFHRCRTAANAGLIGSTTGQMALSYPVFLSHNLGNQPDQFGLFEFIDCDFGIGNIQGGGVKSILIERTRCGYLDVAAKVTANQCTFDGMNRTYSGWSLTERNCVHTISGELRRNPVGGTVNYLGCTFDGRSLTNIQGGVPQASLFTREQSLNMVFRNNLVLMPTAAIQASVYANLRNTDVVQMSNNAYSIGGNPFAYRYNDGSSIQNRTLAQWQALGFDSQSLSNSSLNLTGLRPLSGSPLIDAGLNIGPLQDYTGKMFQLRNDIGAYESPPSTFSSWQTENFTTVELADPLKSGPNATPANDGLPNFMKYALGVPAWTSNLASVQVTHQSTGVLQVIYQRSLWTTDVVLALKSSTNLSDWNAAQILGQTILNRTDHYETVLATVQCPAMDRTFVRLEATDTSFQP